jgi:hypothetical protein
MTVIDHDDYFARQLADIRNQFVRYPSNHNAAALLRAIYIARCADLISDRGRIAFCLR